MSDAEQMADYLARKGYNVMLMEDGSVTLDESVWEEDIDEAFDRFDTLQRELKVLGYTIVGEDIQRGGLTATVVRLDSPLP